MTWHATLLSASCEQRQGDTLRRAAAVGDADAVAALLRKGRVAADPSKREHTVSTGGCCLGGGPEVWGDGVTLL